MHCFSVFLLMRFNACKGFFMSERINLVLDDGIGEMMTQLAGGERKRGQWLSDLIKAMYEQQAQPAASDLDALRFGFSGLAGQVKAIDTRLARVEQQLVSMIAQG